MQLEDFWRLLCLCCAAKKCQTIGTPIWFWKLCVCTCRDVGLVFSDDRGAPALAEPAWADLSWRRRRTLFKVKRRDNRVVVIYDNSGKERVEKISWSFSESSRSALFSSLTRPLGTLWSRTSFYSKTDLSETRTSSSQSAFFRPVYPKKILVRLQKSITAGYLPTISIIMVRFFRLICGHKFSIFCCEKKKIPPFKPCNEH